ncbi:hypothetical protein [Streptomyces violaceusniger]|uniref:hypothetical protein n=1 Tax=Streptomyces violaceusniger TaxID=68280 RepID=UPI003822034C
MSKHTIVVVNGPEGEERLLTARPATGRPPPLGALAKYFEPTCHRAPSRSAVTGEGWGAGCAVLNRWTIQHVHGTPLADPRHDLGTAAGRAHRSPPNLWGGFS